MMVGSGGCDMDTLLSVLANACFVMACAYSLIAAVGMVRFPDLLSRMHAATKPQVVGLELAFLGLALELRSVWVAVVLLCAALLQAFTIPIASHMVGRACFRAGQVRRDLLIVDELSEVLGQDEPRGAP